MEGSAWARTERRGRVLAEEAVCRAHSGGLPDVRWLRSAAMWLAQAAPAWEELAAEEPGGMDTARMESGRMESGWMESGMGSDRTASDDGPGERRYRLIASTPQFEAWLICWSAGGRLELHDHGGAPGALRLVRGSLLERHTALLADPAADAEASDRDSSDLMVGPVQERLLVAGKGIAFDSRYVHDVINTRAAPATSVHVYGAAHRAMRFYRLPAGRTRSPVGPPAGTGQTGSIPGSALVEVTGAGA